MIPLKVALFVKGTPAGFQRDERGMGYWSYAVPEFTWKHYTLANGRDEHRSMFGQYDLIFLEDIGGNAGKIIDEKGPPIVYLAIDSTLSDLHYKTRLEHAKGADLILVDHDNLGRFPRSKRLGYCVNDKVFTPAEKEIDIAFHCASGASRGNPGGNERNELRAYLGDLSKKMGLAYTSGVLGLLEYAQAMGKARLTANWPRTPINRPHRVFDAMACRSCLVTGPIPHVSGDGIERDAHYVQFDDKASLPHLVDELLDGRWAEIADCGYKLVRERHTWAIRARELRELLGKELGL